MKRGLRGEFVYQVFSLLVAFILVHAVYVSVIRPNAVVHLQAEQARLQQDDNYVEQRSLYVVLRDYEQESCFILMLWALSILGYKGITVLRQQRQLERDLLRLPPDLPIGQEDLREIAVTLRSLPGRETEYLRWSASLLPETCRTSPPPPGTSVNRRRSAWNRSSPSFAMLPGPYLRWVLSALCAASVMPWDRRTARCQAISPVSPNPLAWPSIPPSSHWSSASS